METIAFRSRALGLVAVSLPRYAVGYIAMDCNGGKRTAVIVVLKRQDMQTTYQARDYALKELKLKKEAFTPTSALPIGYQSSGAMTLYSFALFEKHDRGANFVGAESTPDINGTSIKSAEQLIKDHTGIDVLSNRTQLAAELEQLIIAAKEKDEAIRQEDMRTV